MTIEMKSVKTKDGWVLKRKKENWPGSYELTLMLELEFGFSREPKYATDIYGRVYEKEVALW